MNILFLIGNGFDINLGMKTRYCDFYEHYKKIESKSELVSELKEEIASGIINWSDLELAFGKYTSKIKDLKEFDVLHEDIVDNLADYLSQVESNIDLKIAKIDKFLDGILLPERYLTDGDRIELIEYRSIWKGYDPWNINIITLNYTKSIERILGDNIRDSLIGKNIYGNNVRFKDIYHIHGYTEERVVLGVNDISQIDNADFHENEEILESLVKTTCNKIQRHNIDKSCENIIKDSNMICIFGSSLGDTDNYLWSLIGDQLRKNNRIIIFSKGEEVKARFAQKAARTKREIKNLFLSKTNLSDNEKQEFRNNIYVGMNTSLFNIM